MTRAGVFLRLIDHALLDVFAIKSAVTANPLGQTPGEVPDPRTNIGNSRIAPNTDRIQRLVRAFFALPLRPGRASPRRPCPLPGRCADALSDGHPRRCRQGDDQPMVSHGASACLISLLLDGNLAHDNSQLA
jgi:hypothetical protein